MSDLNKHRLAAVEAVSRNFSATWNPPDSHITAAGKRIVLQIATLKRRGAGKRHAARPRLRFDKVATRVLNRLRVAACEAVPAGMTVVLTITAPIHLASKTTASLEDTMRTHLARKRLGRDQKDTVCGNCVRIRLLRNKSARAPKLIGFVHNSDSDPLLLLDMTHEMLELFSAKIGNSAPRPAGERWLVVTSAEGIACLEAYRWIYSQLRMPTGFGRILMVFADGNVGTLTQ